MTLAEQLTRDGEYFAAGLFEFPEREPFYRYSNAFRRFYQQSPMTPYDGGRLYPCGRSIFWSSDAAVFPSFSFTMETRLEKLAKRSPYAVDAVRHEAELLPDFPSGHTIGGAGYTHSFINYPRILAEGLNGYRERVAKMKDDSLREGLTLVLEAIDAYHARCLEEVIRANGDSELIEALRRVPDEPPRTLYEALVCWNFMYYADGCDNIGRLDQDLLPYYRGEDATELFRELFRHVDANDGWSGALGPVCNDLTVQCIDAIHYIRRPNLQLRVTRDTPDRVWDAVYRSLSTSCGQPALYNEEVYQREMALREPSVTPEDRQRLSFGGCTETMLEGCSNVGSDDGGLHTALIFDQFMRGPFVNGEFDDFDSLYASFRQLARDEVVKMLEDVVAFRKARAQFRPQPIRTLLIDDCIDKELEYTNGGARYVWGVANVSGMINVIDSLLVIRQLVYREKRYTPKEFLAALDAREPEFLALARRCPCWGVDNDDADALGVDLAEAIYTAYDLVECWPRGHFYPVSNQFTTTEGAGQCCLATPDGRAARTPTCDSLGAVHGKDTAGPTALLDSVAKLPLYKVFGTPVMNLRISKSHLPAVLRPLTETFFEKGGMQLQISCVSREEMEDALVHPEKHENLVVRIGGYSEYFNRLTPALKQDMLNRTEY